MTDVNTGKDSWQPPYEGWCFSSKNKSVSILNQPLRLFNKLPPQIMNK